MANKQEKEKCPHCKTKYSDLDKHLNKFVFSKALNPDYVKRIETALKTQRQMQENLTRKQSIEK